MRNKKGQAAMEFLTTYGWAFLVIIVVISGLYYMGVFDTSQALTPSCRLDHRLLCGNSFSLSNSEVGVRVTNNNNEAVEVREVRIVEKGIADATTGALPYCSGTSTSTIPAGQAGDITAPILGTAACGLGAGVEGDKKIFLIEIDYKIGSSTIMTTSAGQLTTVVS